MTLAKRLTRLERAASLDKEADAGLLPVDLAELVSGEVLSPIRGLARVKAHRVFSEAAARVSEAIDAEMAAEAGASLEC